MIKELAKYIDNSISTLTLGTNLFAGFSPPESEGDDVTLVESGGVPDFDLPDRRTKTVQVLTRSRNYWTARQNAELVFALLHAMKGVSLPVVETAAYWVDTGEALSVPQSLGQDEKGRHVISTNYVLRIGNV